MIQIHCREICVMSVRVTKRARTFGENEFAEVPTWGEHQSLENTLNKLKDQSKTSSQKCDNRFKELAAELNNKSDKFLSECDRINKWLDNNQLAEVLQNLCQDHVKEIDRKSNLFRQQGEKDKKIIAEGCSKLQSYAKDNQQIRTEIIESRKTVEKIKEEINAESNLLREKLSETTNNFIALSANCIKEIDKRNALYSQKFQEQIVQVEKSSNNVLAKLHNDFNLLQNNIAKTTEHINKLFNEYGKKIDNKIIRVDAQAQMIEKQAAIIHEKCNTIRKLTTDFEQQLKQCSTFAGRIKWLFFGCK